MNRTHAGSLVRCIILPLLLSGAHVHVQTYNGHMLIYVQSMIYNIALCNTSMFSDSLMPVIKENWRIYELLASCIINLNETEFKHVFPTIHLVRCMECWYILVSAVDINIKWM